MKDKLKWKEEMEGENTKPKILIFGGTGYLGKYMVKASVSSGHNTFVYARPVTKNSRTSKLEIHKEFQGWCHHYWGYFITQLSRSPLLLFFSFKCPSEIRTSVFFFIFL